ncbi:MAG: hypothetical protein COW65_19040 [Cytophagales bacterium CG18_big_fil_WC_8_21_14_2_50_42_9]|nr:MAG: hypothetical protein COW65_19040 [Cytophagales bacterium CG18_big_fil_WC_8_21_14_2_50_42_9]
MIKAQVWYVISLGLLLSYCKPEVKTPDSPHQVDTELIRQSLLASTTDWNKGDLDRFLSVYDSAATFMTAKGLIGLDTLKAHYQKNYFTGTQPKQQLAFQELQVKPLGNMYALVTGKFVLTGAGQPEQSGRFSLVFHLTNAGWRILHDHSS